MSDDRFLELAPLAALDALDGEDLVAFRQHLPLCPECRRELGTHERVAATLSLALDAVPPAPELRARTLAAAGLPSARPAWAWLPAAAAAAFAALAVLTHLDRNAARRDHEGAEARLETATTEARHEHLRLEGRLREQAVLVDLLTHRDTKLTLLAAGPPTGQEPTGRVLWNPTNRRAVLIAEGLPPAPAGSAYEVWVIASGPPRPAGVFVPDAGGRALFTLPEVAETAQPRTFAVTLEPAAGVPAPTGPMVLAGAVG